MKNILLFLISFIAISAAQSTTLNQKIVSYVVKNGKTISPTYRDAVCTEFVIAVLDNFVILTETDKRRIRIITNKNVDSLRTHKSPIVQGVCYALTSSGKGVAIQLNTVKPGDFVQFWIGAWGHCGIVKSIDLPNKRMQLYSSFPSTQGYGVQEFSIVTECWFVRLK